jgi:hypothetical protein
MYLFEYIRVEGVVKFMKHFNGGASYKILGTSVLDVLLFRLSWLHGSIIEGKFAVNYYRT